VLVGHPEDLDRTLPLQLLEGLVELLAPGGVVHHHPGEVLGWEERNRVVVDIGPLHQRVPQHQLARVDQAHHVAWEGLIDRLTLLGKEPLGIGQADHLSGPDAVDLHAALEAARAHPEKSHPVAMPGVHVGLNLEDEPRELGLGRLDRAAVAVARSGRRSQAQELFQEELDSEVGQGATEEDRGDLARQEGLVVEILPRRLEQLGFLRETGEHVGIHHACHVLGARVGHPDPGLGGPMPGSFKEVQLPALHLVDTLEARAVSQGPVHGDRVHAQDLLDLSQQVQGILGRTVHLVDEGQNRQPALATHVEELQGLGLDALGGVQDHDGAVDGQQRPVGVLTEVLVPRGVQQVQQEAVILEAQDGGGHRDPALLLDLHEVRSGVRLRAARPDRSGQVHRPAVQQELLGEGGLAGVGMRDDRKGPPTADLFDDPGGALEGFLHAGVPWFRGFGRS